MSGNAPLAQVQMMDFRLIHLHCSTNQELIEPGVPNPKSDYDFVFEARTPDEIELPFFQVAMNLHYTKCEGSNVFPFESLEVVAVGMFFVVGEPDKIDESFLATYAIPSAKSLLYGVLRGLLAPVTSKFVEGERFILPAISHEALMETTPKKISWQTEGHDTRSEAASD